MRGLKRRFVQVGVRKTHYLRAGDGPPAVLIHSSPANAWLLMPEIERLSKTHTVFAPDTPGFGLSDPLPLTTMRVADLADALAETLDAMGMPACPMFGSHTGAAIALEFAARHPARLTGLVLDGVPAFTQEECDALFGDYFRDLPPTDLGGQYTEVWTRFRDQSIWFPWSERRPENLNPYDLGSPESTHLWATMYFEAAETYKPAYKAASHYGAEAIAAATVSHTPTIYTATYTDMLFPHLGRLPPLKPGQEIRRIGQGPHAKGALIAEGFARFGSPGAAPTDRDALASSATICRQFRSASHGGQIHLRHAGEQTAPPLLLLHDGPGSSAQWEPLIHALGRHWFVIAPDLPGSGESDPLPPPAPSMRDFGDGVRNLLDELGIPATRVYGIGFGASVGLDLAHRFPERVSSLALRGLLAGEEGELRALAAAYTPPISIQADGGHWYRAWLMLRDSLVWWPWYDRRVSALRRAAESFDARRLHRWTVDVMRRRETYGHLIQAALGHDARAALTALDIPPLWLNDPLTPLSVYEPCAFDLRPDMPRLTVDPDPEVHVRTLAASTDWRF